MINHLKGDIENQKFLFTECEQDNWHFINHQRDFLENGDVIIPEGADFLYIDTCIDFINQHTHKNIVFDFVSSDYPLSVTHYELLKSKFKSKNIRIVTPNIYLFGKEYCYWYDPKIRQMDYIYDNSKVFDEILIKQQQFLRTKKYLYLTSHPRYERVQLLDLLHKDDLIKHGSVGFPSIEGINSSEIDMITWKKLSHSYKISQIKDSDYNLPLIMDFARKTKDYSTNKKHQLWNGSKWIESDLGTGDFNLVPYFNNYFEIYSETYYYGFGSVESLLNEDVNGEYLQVSEKTLKPIANMIPFFCLTDSNFYKTLMEMGLEFNSEFYSDIPSLDILERSEEKVHKFYEIVKKFCEMDITKLHEIFYNSTRELINNKYALKNTLDIQLLKLFK
jgi:hypothetical protein|tara:strand:+ start:6724 stop:7893 length:1170 start_codon:yes stop_codon:yes gene_type:complete